MLVKELKPRMSVTEITLEIVSKGEPRSFASAQGQGMVCNAAAKDESGEEISLTLWNDQVKEVEEGQTVKITNGWTSEFQGQLQISTGKMGTLEVVK
jgi:replication factor A1